MNETAERRQGAENACQRLRRRVLTATAALAAAALVFGWLAAGAVRRSEVFTWGSLEVSFTGEGFTGSPAVGEGVSECAPAVNVQPGSEACYLFLALGKTGGQQWGHWAGGAFAPGPLEGWSPLEGTDGAVYYCQVEAVGKKKRKPRCASSCLTGCRAARRARERRSRYTPFRAAAWPRPARPGRR